MNDAEIMLGMTVALAVGLVIGFERGWHERDAPEGGRIAGIRTFALVSLSGGLVAVLGTELNAMIATAITVAFGGLLVAVRIANSSDPDRGATTEVAAVVAFSLGALAGLGHWVPAMAGAVISALLLGLKPVLHGWLRIIEQREVLAALQFLLISAVVLPLLPDAGFGPFAALNPYRLWWMVVLVAGVSFAGYIGMKLLSSRAGLLLTGLCGGLATSTATTLALARRARELDPSLTGAVAAGIVAANTAMLLRLSVLVAFVYPPLLGDLAAPFCGALLAGAGVAGWLWWTSKMAQPDSLPIRHGNPLDLAAALGFGFALAVVMILVEACRATFGTSGLYGLAAVAGLVDTDAITLSLAEQAQRQLPGPVAALGLMIAAVVNTAIKTAIAFLAGPAALGRRIALAHGAMISIGGAAILVQRSWLP